jgi:hypothetical protein
MSNCLVDKNLNINKKEQGADLANGRLTSFAIPQKEALNVPVSL